MDSRINPFTPNAGARPPALVGRDSNMDDFRLLLDRLSAGYDERSLLFTGLRGVGKTVLLNEFDAIAQERGWVSRWAEISPRYDFAPRLYNHVRSALLDLSPRAKWSDRFRHAAGILKSFSLTFAPDGSVSAGLNVDAVEGKADTGFLEEDVPALMLALGDAALEAGTGVVFLFDELQFLQPHEFESLIAALHRLVQKELPVTLVGAGLPQLPELAGEARSYAERLFRLCEIGRLSKPETDAALQKPVEGHGLRFTGGALDRLFALTHGYPYFIQEYGRVLWNEVEDGEVLSTHVAAIEQRVIDGLDNSFYRVRTDRTSADQLLVLRGMAEYGEGPARLADIAGTVRLKEARVRELLGELTSRALIYSPKFGLYGFTVPQYDSYLRRTYPLVDGRIGRDGGKGIRSS